MEFKPSKQDITQRDTYSQQRLEAAERISRVAAERAHTAEQAQRTAEELRQRAEHYLAVLGELRNVATDRNPHDFSSDTTHCIAARATEWIAFGVDTNSNLTTEGRYLAKDIVTTRQDHSHQKVVRRSFVEVIEIHRCDESIDYVSSPEVVTRLYNDEIAVTTESRNWGYRFNVGGDWQTEVDDFITTVMEPIVVGCGAHSMPGPDQPALDQMI